MGGSLVLVEVDCEWSQERLAQTLTTLPDKIQARANRYLSSKARRSLLASQWALRAVLDHLDIPPSHLEVCPKGRPYLTCGTLEFNLSHSESRAVLIFGKSTELKEALGVDVEWCSRRVEKKALAKRFFTEREFQYTEQQSEFFFRVWTRKEAVLKTNGVGLRVPLNSFEVLEDLVSPDATGHPLGLGTALRSQDYMVSWAVPQGWRDSKIHWVEADTDDWLQRVAEGIGV